jgi:hypothetical protein
MPPVTLSKVESTVDALCNTGANLDEIIEFTTIDGETYSGVDDTIDGQVIWVAHKPSVDDTNFRHLPVPVGHFIVADQKEGSFGFIVLRPDFVADEYGYMHSDPEAEPEPVPVTEPDPNAPTV